jgi:hypothetical protein
MTNILWNCGGCMAKKNKKTEEQCCRTVIHMSDFCRYHYKNKIYDIFYLHKKRILDYKKLNIDIKKINLEIKKTKSHFVIDDIIDNISKKIKSNTEELNKSHMFSLIGLNQSWDIVPPLFRICLGKNWWNITTIINHFTQQLNESKMENAYPAYPSNPFNRMVIPVDELLKLKQRIIHLDIKINIAFKIFLQGTNADFKIFYEEATNNFDGHSKSIINYFNQKLRYKLINCTDSQNSFMGFWTKKYTPKSIFEIIFEEWKNTPYQIYSDMHGGIDDNPRKFYLYTKLQMLKSENWYLGDMLTKFK